jgi:hypothetical protein
MLHQASLTPKTCSSSSKRISATATVALHDGNWQTISKLFTGQRRK